MPQSFVTSVARLRGLFAATRKRAIRPSYFPSTERQRDKYRIGKRNGTDWSRQRNGPWRLVPWLGGMDSRRPCPVRNEGKQFRNPSRDGGLESRRLRASATPRGLLGSGCWLTLLSTNQRIRRGRESKYLFLKVDLRWLVRH
jgi:hypothetical protein